MEKRESFFNFELENKLFDLVDDRGLCPWEAVRYHVFNRVIYGNIHSAKPHTVRPHYMDLIKHVINIFSFLFYVLSHFHRKILFILCSRDKKGGIYFDKISDQMYVLSDLDNIMAFDTECHTNGYKYRGLTTNLTFLSMLCRLPWHGYNFQAIIKVLKKNFPEEEIEKQELEGYYKEFVAQYYFYKYIFRFVGIKKVFMVQNGIQKGLFAAAKKMDVEVIEFQHGQISINHPAYSYPDNPSVNATKIYQPSKLLTFGTFWNKNRYYPGVENIVIGNDIYSVSRNLPNTGGNKRLMVISNMGEGEMLAKCVKEITDIDKSFFFYFKLHPNQYNEFPYYNILFKDNTNVEVISDEKSVNDLLVLSEAVLLAQSTVALEALREGRKVFVVKLGLYESMDFLFSEEGVYLINNSKDFINTYYSHSCERIIKRTDLFSNFQINTAKALLQ